MARGRKKNQKTGQQSKGGGDDNVGIGVPTNPETISGDGNDDALDENRNNEGGKDVGNDTNVVGKSSGGDNGDGDNSDGFVNSIGGNDSNYVGNLPVSGDNVGKRKKKVKTEQQSKGGGDDNLGLDVPINNETTIGDGNEDVLDENRNNGGGKDICNDANDVGKSSDGENGDGDNRDGFVNSISGNDSNDVVHPPASGDAVGERKKKVNTGQQSKGEGDNRTRKLASSITSQCLYDDVFTMHLCHFLPNDLDYLTYTIQQIITYSTSLPNRCIMNPVAEDDFEVGSWTTTPKVITAGSSLGFEGNACEDSLSSQSSYKINSGCCIMKLPLLQIQSF
jgi:hypothetical protein